MLQAHSRAGTWLCGFPGWPCYAADERLAADGCGIAEGFAAVRLLFKNTRHPSRRRERSRTIEEGGGPAAWTCPPARASDYRLKKPRPPEVRTPRRCRLSCSGRSG